MLKKILVLLFLPVITWAADFIEGKDYTLVTSSASLVSKNKGPVVTEFFSYGCPWCYRIEAPLNEWSAKMGSGARVERVPVVFKPDWELYAKAYYTAKTLALSERMSPILFKTIQDDKQPLNTPQAMTQLFVTHGVDKEIAKSAFEHSSVIDLRVKNGMALMTQYQIHAVPAFVVNNKYKTDLQMAGSPERLFEIMNYLVRKSA